MSETNPIEAIETSEQRLIRLLRENEPYDQATGELLRAWTIEQETMVEGGQLTAIELNLRRARLYFAAGYKEEAIENFEAARKQAHNERNVALYDAIMSEMDRLNL